MAGSESSAWVFDSLVGFLHGPVWNDPLQSFIEEKSLPFEPADNGEVQHRQEYKQIHNEYKDLVDVMLSTFMEDIGITSEQFECACRMSAKDLAGLPAHFHRRLFDQIWAANDYDIFVKMMTHKNVELQLHALELIERRFGARPHIFTDADQSPRSEDSGDWSDRDQVMNEVKQLSLEEPSDDTEVDVPPEAVIEEKQSLLLKLHSFDKNEERKAEAKKQEEEAETAAIEESPEEVEELSDEPVVKPPATKVKAPPPPLPVVLPVLKKVELVSEDDVKARQEYLKQQRDKLLALKKRVRERRLGAAQEEEQGAAGGEGEAAAKPARPRSARVAAAAMAGSAPKPPPDAMTLRRALATKLKTEVVDTQRSLAHYVKDVPQ